ncbi:MAG: HAMP domain-containing protein [Thermoanaerobaculia bacterium]|nr:HAMP domain-containing protein [Thermoanaerobaculia bacterium]
MTALTANGGTSSNLARRYAAWLAVPPLVILLPVALSFLVHVLRLGSDEAFVLAISLSAAYAAGAVVFGLSVARSASRVERALDSGVDPSDAVSEALQKTSTAAFVVWVVCGLLIAVAGAMFFDSTLAGLRYFAEAALIVAAPAMAWSYCTGKRMLVAAVPPGTPLAYRGRTYSIGLKLGIVFGGFFIVSLGAVVNLISSRLAVRLQQSGIAAEDIVADVTRHGLMIAVITAVFFALAIYLLARDITTPLDELIEVANEMASGHFDQTPRVFSDDEIGRLAGSFGATRSNLRTLLARVGGSGGAVTSGVKLMTAGTENLLTGAREQQRATGQTVSAIDQVRNDARSVLEAVDKVSGSTFESASRATELSASFSEVARRMDELFQSVEKSSSSTLEIDASAREMSSRTSRLAGAGNEVLAFVSEMDASVEQISRTADENASLSTEVRQNAIAGRDAVDATVEGIRSAQASTRRTMGTFEELQKSLGEIDRILDFIGELTNRTNLLSLNAAIIAAQAGANDFGFSVIADEVRQLAERTRSATKEIAGIVRNVQPIARQAVGALEEGVANVDRTVKLAQGARDSLGTILSSSDRSLDMVRNMTRAMQEQSQASRHLHEVVSSVSETIDEINRATQGQAEATRLLAMEAERVRDIALQVKRASEEQIATGRGISTAMELIADDVLIVRTRLEGQLASAEEIAIASQVTLEIAQRNNQIAEEFTSALQSLVTSENAFQGEVGKFRV